MSSLWDVKEPTQYLRRVEDEVTGVVAVIRGCMGGWVGGYSRSTSAIIIINNKQTNKQTNTTKDRPQHRELHVLLLFANTVRVFLRPIGI